MRSVGKWIEAKVSRRNDWIWRWPWYFRCWQCYQIHTDCTCGAYECLTHEACLEAERRERLDRRR